MLIIVLKGNWGNQLFQFALSKELQNLGYEIAFDTSWYKHNSIKLLIDSAFSISLSVIGDEITKKYANLDNSYFSRVRKKIMRKSTHLIEKQSMFNNYIFDLDNKNIYILDGYWQSYRYFDNVLPYLKNLLFTESNRAKYREILKNRYGCNKIFLAIHVRGGDYKNNSQLVLLKSEYYEKAYSFIRRNISSEIIPIVFSDDIDETKKRVYNIDYKYCDWTSNAMEDFFLMASCHHHIIANSSFSYWAAILSENEIGHSVIYPNVWFKHISSNKLGFMFMKNWIMMQT